MLKNHFAVFLILWGFGLFAADYEILDRADQIKVESNDFASEHHLEVVRILTDEGTDYRKIIPVNGYIRIKNVTGTVIFPDGHTTKIKQEEIAELPLIQSPDMLTDYKALVVAPDELQRGCTVRIEYDRLITNLLYLESWIYATSVPVKKATCSLTFPSHVPVKYRADDSSLKIQKSNLSDLTTLQFETADQKQVSIHGANQGQENVEKRVQFLPEHCMTERWQLSTNSWQEIAQWFSELSRFAYSWDPAMDAVVNDITAKYKDPEKIAEALYEYIQKNYVYTAIEIGIGGYKPRFASQTFSKKYGDCKDLTLLYLTLLKKAGIEGYPALVDTHSQRFFYRDFPAPMQFNHCITYLPRIRNGTWVDSTVKNFMLGEVPSAIQGKYALVSGGPNALLKIPEDFYNSNILRFKLSGTMDERDLKMAGKVLTMGIASSLIDSLQNALMKNNTRYYVYSTLLIPGAPIRSLQANYEDTRSLSLSFTTPVNQLQQYRLLLINAMHYPSLDKLALEPEPNQFFALGMPLRLIVESTVDLSGRHLVSTPFKKEAKGKYVSYVLELREDQGKLYYLADAYFANGLLESAEMKNCQKELRDFSALVQRTVIVE